MNEILRYLMIFIVYFMYFLLLIIVFKLIFQGVVKTAHSNWSTLLDGCNYSSQEFYRRLKEELQSQGIKNVQAYTVSLREGGLLSSSRLYLRLEWKEYQYDICASPFGKGFFISWWLLYNHSLWKILIAKIPYVGKWLDRMWFPMTYYKVDIASMFMTYCQSSVLKVIDDISKEKGMRSLSEDQRKPMLKDMFKR